MKVNEKKAGKMLKYSSIDSFEVSWNGEMVHAATAGHSAILCTSGSGTLVSNEHISRLNEGEVYLLAPGQRFKLAADEQALKGCIVRFEVYEYGGEQQLTATHAFMEGLFWCKDREQLALSCDRLLQMEVAGDEEHFNRQAALYGLMTLLVQAEAKSESTEPTASAIARVADYMNEHLDHELKRDELAMLAGLSPGYFSWAFQQYTGKTPTAYLMDVRMKRAKELLLSGDGVKETAVRVGYEDEFYFSRRFKQKMGLSPNAFVKSRRYSIASVSDPISGSLLALGLLPKAAAFYPNHELYNRMTRLHSYELGEGQIWQENVDQLRASEPELIFCTDILAERARKELEQIAPTVAIPWLSTDWREQLRTIAEVMEHRAEAETWLSEYDGRAEAVYRKVRRNIGGATVNIWRITDSEYRIYGKRNAGAVLYNDFRLAATHRLDDINVFEAVTKEALEKYDADMLIIMVDSTQQAAREWKALQASEQWHRLIAVRHGHVYEVGTEKLFEYSAWSHDRALTYFMRLFG
ncbi:helix-turn-helix domain-containing protein [Paenibacillus taichungensis]|uniref:helix-turn-helix domain-containing protein n=1 Tax=Paenibacillus taichungensis TaxID=484184 RepID=UPI0038CF89B0